jgi:hypothetical protein
VATNPPARQSEREVASLRDRCCRCLGLPDGRPTILSPEKKNKQEIAPGVSLDLCIASSLQQEKTERDQPSFLFFTVSTPSTEVDTPPCESISLIQVCVLVYHFQTTPLCMLIVSFRSFYGGVPVLLSLGVLSVFVVAVSSA